MPRDTNDFVSGRYAHQARAMAACCAHRRSASMPTDLCYSVDLSSRPLRAITQTLHTLIQICWLMVVPPAEAPTLESKRYSCKKRCSHRV